LDHIETLNTLKKSSKVSEIQFSEHDENKIAEDENVIIYKSESQKNCVKYGHGYSFCISRPSGGNMYNSYRLSKHSSFYFIFFKKIPKKDVHHIMVLDKTQQGFEWTFADNHTKSTTWNDIVSQFPVLQKYENLFINNPLSETEKDIIRAVERFRQDQSLEKFQTFPEDYKQQILKSGITLIDDIYVYLESNKLWNLINEYVSVGPNLTPLQVDSIRNKGGSILTNYLKNREQSILDLMREHQYQFNILDKNNTTIQKIHKQSYERAYKLIADAIEDEHKVIQLTGCKYLFELPDNIPDTVNYFDCSSCNLLTLKNCPKYIHGGDLGSFNCSSNNLKNLNNGPEEVHGSYICRNMNLPSLEGIAKIIGDTLDCSDNSLTSLVGCPKYLNELYCRSNLLTNLKGSAISINGDFNCSDNKLTSLEGISETIGGKILLRGNPIIFTKRDINTAMEESRKRNILKSESFHYYFYNKETFATLLEQHKIKNNLHKIPEIV
jgi:hypothetical protein